MKVPKSSGIPVLSFACGSIKADLPYSSVSVVKCKTASEKAGNKSLKHLDTFKRIAESCST